MKQQSIHPDDLIFIQSRAETNAALVTEYAELMTDEEFEFDPVEALEDGDGGIFVYDGSHRGAAAQQLNRPVRVNLTPGTRQEAEWLALSANQKHGLRRSREDKQYVVRQALLHPHGVERSDREIGRHCGVDHKTVGQLRAEMVAAGEIPQVTARTVTRNGVTYQQETAGISATGKKDVTASEPAEADDLPDWLRDEESEGDNDDKGAPLAAPPDRLRPGSRPPADLGHIAAALPAQPRQRTLKFAQVNEGGIALEVMLYIDGVAHSLPVTAMLAHGPIAGLPEMSLDEEEPAALILPYETARRLNLVYLDNVAV